MLDRIGPLEAERVPVERAAGRVLAEAPAAVTDLPPFPSSAMDGFAVRAGDVRAGVSLPVVGEVAAGSPAQDSLDAGQVMAISTGGMVPDGADAVVPIEVVDESDGTVTFRQGAEPGAHVRVRGGDTRAGEPVLEPGTELGPAQIGALAAAGVHEVQCRKRPRVGILATGSELRQPGESLNPGEIYESNGLLLAAALSRAGAVPAQLGVVPDDEDALERTMERALLGFDMLVTAGGVSVGPHDLVRKVQAGLRAEEVFWGVAVKPGKPVAFSMRRAHPLFNLPGNPVSVLVTFLLFVQPAINVQLGRPEPLPTFSRGILASAVRRNERRHEFVRARSRREGDDVVLEPLGGQESHMIVRAGGADSLVSIEPGAGEVDAGEGVRYLAL